MKPNTASRLVSFILSMPGVVGISGVAGSLLAAGPASAQAVEIAASMPPDSVPSWLAPLLPMIVGALVGSGGIAAAWVLRTFFGVSLAALAAGLDAGGVVLETRARATRDPSDDAPASALAAAMRAAAKRLREAENDMPGFDPMKNRKP